MRILLTVLLLIAVALPAWADDEPATTKHVDREGAVALQLPEGFEPDDEAQYDRLTGAFRGSVTLGGESTWVAVWVHRLDAYARPLLALDEWYRGQDHERFDRFQDVGDDYAQIAARTKDADYVTFRRAVAAADRVHVVTVQVGTKDEAAAHPVAHAILATALVEAPPAWPALPQGWRVSEKKGVRLATDRKGKAEPAAVLREVVAVRAIARKVLGGEPYLQATARVLAYDDEVIYRDRLEKLGLDPDLQAIFQSDTRTLHVNLAQAVSIKEQRSRYWDVIRRQAARQAVFEHFGGSTPVLVEWGLANYVWVGAESGGKPNRPQTWFVQAARDHVSQPRALSWWLDATWTQVLADVNTSIYESWTWHRLLRDAKGGKPFREAYTSYLTLVREQGGPRAASRVLRDLDQEALLDALTAFIERGK